MRDHVQNLAMKDNQIFNARGLCKRFKRGSVRTVAKEVESYIQSDSPEFGSRLNCIQLSLLGAQYTKDSDICYPFFRPQAISEVSGLVKDPRQFGQRNPIIVNNPVFRALPNLTKIRLCRILGLKNKVIS